MRALLVVVLLLLGGAALLRLHDLPDQLLGDDEFHAVRAAVEYGPLELLSHYPPNDNSLLLSLWARLLLSTTGLTEISLRLPSVLSGLLLLLLPWWLRRELGAGASVAATALLAASPVCIYYTIVARPYAPAALLTGLMLVAWVRWRRTPGTGAALACGALAGASVVAHLFSAPAALALACLALVSTLRGQISRAQLGWATLAGGSVTGALLGPGASALLSDRLTKTAQGELSLLTWLQTALVLAGQEPGLLLLLLVCAVLGLAALVRQRSPLGPALAASSLATVAALFLADPLALRFALARYLFPVWPALLLAAAVGLVPLLGWLGRCFRRPLPALLALVVVLGLPLTLHMSLAHGAVVGLPGNVTWPFFLLVPAGVLAAGRSERAVPAAVMLLGLALAGVSLFLGGTDVASQPNSFRGWSGALNRVPAEAPPPLPPAYAWVVAHSTPDEVLLLHPAVRTWPEWGLLRTLQRSHGRPVKLCGAAQEHERGQNLSWRGYVDPQDDSALAASGARYLLAHLDWLGEHRRARLQPPGPQRPASVAALAARFGPPVFRDRDHAVFELPQRP